MNWDAIGALAELLAVIAVLPTLLYLAIQLRQNTLAVRSQTIHSLIQDLTATVQALVESESLTDLMVRAQEDYDSLSSAERARFSYLLMMIVRRFEGVHFQRQLGFIDVAATAGFERSILSIIASNPAWWDKTKPIFSDEFVVYVTQQLSQQHYKGIHTGLGGNLD